MTDMADSPPTHPLDANPGLFKQLVDQAHDAVYLVSPEAGFRMVYANAACCTLFGYPAETLLQMAVPDWAPEWSLERCDASWKTLQATKAATFETPLKTGQGTILPVEVTSTYLTIEGTDYAVGMVRDLSERQAAREALQQTEQRLRDLLDHSTNVHYSHTPDHRLIYLSPQAAELLGCTIERALIDWKDFLTDNPANRTGIEQTQRAIDTGQAQEPYELELKTQDGRIVWVEVHEAPVVRQGKTVSIVGALTDITEVKRQRDALKSVAERGLRQGLALLTLADESSLRKALPASLQQITETIARTLGVGRVSVWLFNQDQSAIRCEDLYERERDEHASGMELRATDYPTYFQALAQCDVIDASDALRDPRTWEFTETYLNPLHIGAMLDARLQTEEALQGVLCCEHVGGPRAWTVDEKIFAIAAGHLASLILVQAQRRNLHTRLTLALEAGNIGLWTWDVETGETYLSPSWKAQLGYADEDIPNRYEEFETRLHPDDLDRVREYNATFLAAPSARFEMEIRLRHKDGAFRWLLARAELLNNAQGRRTLLTGCNMDITKHKHLEDAIRRSEQDYRLLLDCTDDGIYGTDTEGQCTFVNQTVIRLLGYQIEDLVGRPIHNVIHHTRPDGSLCPVSECGVRTSMVSGRRYESENEVLWRRDGTSFPVRFSCSSIVDEGVIRGTVAVFTDITDRKALEARAQEQMTAKTFAVAVGDRLAKARTAAEGLHACTQAMVEHLGAAFARIWTLDGERNELVLQASAGMYTNLEGAHQRIPVGQDKVGLIAQERRPYLTNQVLGDPLVHDQAWAKREGMVAFAGYPLQAGNRITGVMAIFARRPLSDQVLQALEGVSHAVAQFIERQRAEAVLAETLGRLQALVHYSPIGIALLDTAGRVRLWNPACEALFGWSEREVLGRLLPTLPASKQGDLPATMERAAKETFVRIREAERIAKDGRHLFVDLSVTALRNASGEIDGYLGMLVDAAERKDLERQSQQMARLSLLTTMLGGIAHQIKNPLFILMGQQQLLRETLESCCAQTLPGLQKAVEATERIAAIVERFLRLARPAGVQSERCSVTARLQHSLGEIRKTLERGHIQLTLTVPPDLPAIEGDPALLDEVFVQLLANAVDAIRKAHGKGMLTVKAELSAVSDQPSAPAERWIEVRIQDNGPGIPPEIRKRLFEPFLTSKPPGEGTGLGLWIVRSNVMMLKGTVQVESEVAKGTTLIVRLPVAPGTVS